MGCQHCLKAVLLALLLGSLIPATRAETKAEAQEAKEDALKAAEAAKNETNSTIAEMEEEEEEVQTSVVGLAVSVMLIGGITFMVSLFYLVNHNDPDIKLYSWRTIKDTISIFVAVLLFAALNDILEHYILEEASEAVELIVDMVHLLLWFFVLHATLAYSSGAVGETPKSIKDVELKTRFWAVLFAHLTAFAAINAWGAIQQNEIFKESVLMSLLPVPIGAAILGVLFGITGFIRTKVALNDDDVVDDFEEFFEEESQDTENDVFGLSLSFIIVQSLRYAIGGALPNQEGIEVDQAEKFNHGPAQSGGLIGVGLGFAAVMVVLVCIGKRQRPIKMLQNFFSMGFAWCVFYGAKWAFQYADLTETETLVRASLAMFLSFASFALIFILDKIADMDATGENADRAIRTIITSLGLVIGFSWEQCFDMAVESITERMSGDAPKCWPKLLITLFLAIIVLPAWRLYILKNVMELEAKSDADPFSINAEEETDEES